MVVIDERGEISSIYRGIMQNDLGIRTDVINDIPKSIGMKIAIRSMAPQVLIADEIGSVQDSEVIKYAVCCGVKGIFTAHDEKSRVEGIDTRKNIWKSNSYKSKKWFELWIWNNKFIKNSSKIKISEYIL